MQLTNKTVKVTVLTFSGKDDLANHILDLFTRALPLLEDIIGVPFPPEYPITVQEFIRQDLGGVSGRNRGENGHSDH